MRLRRNGGGRGIVWSHPTATNIGRISSRCELDVVHRRVDREPIRRRIERHCGAPFSVVEALVDQQDLIVAVSRRRGAATMLTARSTNLEQIREIILEQDCQTQVDRPVAVVAHAEPLIRRVAPQEDRAQNVNSVFFQNDALIGDDDRDWSDR